MQRLVSFFARPAARILLLSTLVALPLAGLAQPPPGRGRGAGAAPSAPPTEAERAARMEARLAELTQRLSLTPQQQAQVRQIYTETRAELDALRQRTRGTERPGRDPAVRAQFRTIRWRAEDRVWTLLSCEQKDQMRLLVREKRAARMDRRMEQGPHPGRGGHRGHHGSRDAGGMPGSQASVDIVEDGDDVLFDI